MSQIQRPSGPMSGAGIQNFGLTVSNIQIDPKIVMGAIIGFIVVVVIFQL